jgi:hypothetical protein
MARFRKGAKPIQRSFGSFVWCEQTLVPMLNHRPGELRMRRLALMAAAVTFSLAVQPAFAVELAAHQASYKLSLESARGGDVTSGAGTMTYEVIDACDGWAVRQRLLMKLTNRDGQDIEMVSDYTTFESKDGLSLRFRMRQTTEQAVTSEVAGDATLTKAGGPGTVTYTLPEKVTKELPAGTVFPSAHTEAFLDAAQAGKKFVALPLFDGTGPSGAQDSSVVITGWNQPAETKWAPLASLPSGRVRIAFFDRDQGKPQPDYEVSMRYYANGVADSLSMDFGDFVMGGKLESLKIAKPGC